MVPEKILFHMPEDPTAFVAAVAVTDAYQKMYAARDLPIELYIDVRVPDHAFLLKTLSGEYKRSSESLSICDVENLDLDFTFDVDRAYRLALTGGRHIAEIFGIMLGVDQPFPYPDMSRLESKEITHDILFLDTALWHNKAKELEEIIFTNAPHLKVNAKYIEEHETLIDAYECVSTAQTVIGPPCTATYLAAAMGRNLIEFIGGDDSPLERFLDKPLRNNVVFIPVSASETLLWNILQRKRWDSTVIKAQ